MPIPAAASRGLSRFAHFAGLAKPKADEEPATTEDVEDLEEKTDDVQDDVEELEDRVDDLEDEVEKKKDEDEPGDDKPAEQAAYRAGRRAGRAAERSRAGAILSTKAAAGNRALALHLAFETGSSAKQALAMLQAAGPAAAVPAKPVPGAGAGLDGRMAGSKPVKVGAGGAGGPDRETAAGTADFILAAAAKARGQSKGA